MRLTGRLSHELKKQLKQAVFLGRLATVDEIDSMTTHNGPVEFNEDTIVFYMKCLSHIPKSISRLFFHSHSLLSGSLFSYQNERVLDDAAAFKNLPHWERKANVQSYLENKTILFQLVPNNDYLNVALLKVEDVLPSDSYVTVPAPDLKASETSDDLQNKLMVDKRPVTLRKYPSMFPAPSMITYGDFVYKVDMESKSNPTTYFQTETTQVDHIELPLETRLDLFDVMYEHHLYFLSSENYQRLEALFKDQHAAKKEIAASTESPVLEPVPQVQELPVPETETPEQHTESSTLSETAFLEQLINRARYKHKLFYRNDDIYSFHISVKTNPLTVLGGMSGTGKSQLARLYGETLGLEEGKTMLFLPISPAYQEPNDILGYLNPKTEIFHESDTGLVSLLLEAEKNPGQLYMVIFDEMNLSQVEHWFSPFLSLLEIDGDKHLTIYHEKNNEKSGYYQPKIKLGNNLIFIGTVNFDETTKSFSDRLLDRTNVITPEKASFSETLQFYEEMDQQQTPVFPVNTITPDKFRKQWKTSTTSSGLHLFHEHEIYILDQLHALINDIDPQKGVSFRVALAIAEYITNTPKNEAGEPLIPRQKLFDFQINQRVLTKIKGLDTFAQPLVGQMIHQGEQWDYQDGKLAALFKSERAQLVSDFSMSLRTLQNKAKELMMYGFTN